MASGGPWNTGFGRGNALVRCSTALDGRSSVSDEPSSALVRRPNMAVRRRNIVVRRPRTTEDRAADVGARLRAPETRANRSAARPRERPKAPHRRARRERGGRQREFTTEAQRTQREKQQKATKEPSASAPGPRLPSLSCLSLCALGASVVKTPFRPCQARPGADAEGSFGGRCRGTPPALRVTPRRCPCTAAGSPRHRTVRRAVWPARHAGGPRRG